MLIWRDLALIPKVKVKGMATNSFGDETLRIKDYD